MNERRIRRSLKTRHWESALQKIRRLEDAAAGGFDLTARIYTVAEAVRSYLSDCRQRHLSDSTLRHYGKTLGYLADFCGGSPIHAVDVETLTRFRVSRVVVGKDGSVPIAPATSRKELETIRGFLAFCVDREWLVNNAARKIKPPKEDSEPTMPFEPSEVQKLLEACNLMRNNNQESLARAKVRARALVLLLLYSGLRISDAAGLRRDRLDVTTRYLFLRQVKKTRVPLRIQLSQEAVDALLALPVESEFFFWSGRSKLSSIIGSLRRTVEALGRIAGVHAHPHRFRDTFACRLLDKGAELRTVQLLLGHRSITTTERHYAPFVRSHQRLLDAAVATLSFDVPGGE